MNERVQWRMRLAENLSGEQGARGRDAQRDLAEHF
jgi:hypothetical protein